MKKFKKYNQNSNKNIEVEVNAHYDLSDELIEVAEEYRKNIMNTPISYFAPPADNGKFRQPRRPEDVCSVEELNREIESYENRRRGVSNNRALLGRNSILRHAPTDFYYNKIRTVLTKTFPGWEYEPRLDVWWPPGGYMGWHTNSDSRGRRIYLKWSEKDDESFFRYRDKDTGEIHTIWDKKGWHINEFYLPNVKQGILWHCVGSYCNAISMGFRPHKAGTAKRGKYKYLTNLPIYNDMGH